MTRTPEVDGPIVPQRRHRGHTLRVGSRPVGAWQGNGVTEGVISTAMMIKGLAAGHGQVR
jgi:hypothetical protein